MKLFYTEKEMQKEIERRMGEFERDRWNNERFDTMQKRICLMEDQLDKLAAQVQQLKHNEELGDMEVPVCQH